MRLAVFGFGNVGRVLCSQAVRSGASISAIADSSGVLLPVSSTPLNSTAFTSQELNSLIELKAKEHSLRNLQSAEQEMTAKGDKVGASEPLGRFLSTEDYVRDYLTLSSSQANQAPLILADCSAFHDPNSYLIPSVGASIPVVLANKKPLTSSFDSFSQLTKSSSLIRFEATVGAGLPVVLTLKRLIDNFPNDRVISIKGTLSGTLAYILSNLSEDKSFSTVVKDGVAKGFTEPDPRDDLSGLDVGRKVLILVRMLGYDLELEDIEIEKLYTDDMEKDEVPAVSDFLQRIGELDGKYGAKVLEAKKKQKELRYTFTIAVKTKGVAVKVGLEEVDGDSVIGRLRGTDNCVVFRTAYYGGEMGTDEDGDSGCLIVSGPGAGLEVTAQGVLSDCFDLHGKLIREGYGVTA